MAEARPGPADATGRSAGRWWLQHGLGPLVLRWWRRRGLRSRVTLTAALGLLVALIAGDLLLLNTLNDSLTRSVDSTARTGASQIVALIDANRLPDPVPAATGTTIQVLNPAGRIINVSSEADWLVPLVPLGQARAIAHSGDAVMVAGGQFDIPAQLRVAVVPATNGDLVIAAVPFAAASGSLSVVARALVFGTPVLFLVFTGAIWLAVGSTLRHIDALRRGAARVTVTGVPTDLPVPVAKDEVQSLSLTLNDMLGRLAAAQQRQRALVSDTAHELRSPLASIRAQLEVAIDHPSSQDWECTARDVLADTLRLSRLAEDLLLLARLDEQAGGVDARQGAVRAGTPIDLTEMSENVVTRYTDARVPVAVACTTASEAAEVLGDRARLERMLVNLVDNAIRYAKSSVKVSVRRDGQWAELAVTDDGPGIPWAADRERAFDRFARLDNARSRDHGEDGGAGLGLAIVRATAQAYGGTAHLESPAGASGAYPLTGEISGFAKGTQGDQGNDLPGLRAVVRLPIATSTT